MSKTHAAYVADAVVRIDVAAAIEEVDELHQLRTGVHEPLVMTDAPYGRSWVPGDQRLIASFYRAEVPVPRTIQRLRLNGRWDRRRGGACGVERARA